MKQKNNGDERSVLNKWLNYDDYKLELSYRNI